METRGKAECVHACLLTQTASELAPETRVQKAGCVQPHFTESQCGGLRLAAPASLRHSSATDPSVGLGALQVWRLIQRVCPTLQPAPTVKGGPPANLLMWACRLFPAGPWLGQHSGTVFKWMIKKQTFQDKGVLSQVYMKFYTHPYIMPNE